MATNSVLAELTFKPRNKIDVWDHNAKPKVNAMTTSLFFCGLKFRTLESTKINSFEKIQDLLHLKFLKNNSYKITN